MLSSVYENSFLLGSHSRYGLHNYECAQVWPIISQSKLSETLIGQNSILIIYWLQVGSGWEVTCVLTGEFHQAPTDSLKLIFAQVVESSELQDKIKNLNVRKSFTRKKKMDKQPKLQHI